MNIEISGTQFTLPTKKLSSGRQVAYVDLLEDTFLCTHIAQLMRDHIQRTSSNVKYIVVPEVKAILLGKSLSELLDLEVVIVRKKLINFTEISQERVASYSSGANRFRYCLSPEAKIKLAGESVAVVDDVLTTGATIAAVQQECRLAGAKVQLALVGFKEGGLVDRPDVEFLASLPLPTQSHAMETFEHFALTAREELPTVYTAMSKTSFCFRTMVTKFAIDSGYAPFNPFMSFDFALHGLCKKADVIRANNTMVKKCDAIWHFGPVSDGSLAELIIAQELGKPIRFFDIAKDWNPVEVPPEQIQIEEDRLASPFNELLAQL